ncbi:MAG TPA: hypothetical protein VHM02_00230 [Thermoanaerobaculia bacterium]|nr:hypothetical protein [Thermoanaerobaculia bacterium]
MEARFYWLVLATLCVWRLTFLLSVEEGPWRLAGRLRRAAGDGFWGRLLDCFYCLSLWIAVPFAVVVGRNTGERLLLWPALSAGAILLLRATDRPPATPPALYSEEPLDVLRTDEDPPPSEPAS